MARIVFEVDIAADTNPIVAALDTERGIASWWTDEVTFAGGVGSTMTLGFPTAPKPFVLQVAQVGSERVRWESIGDFPPHWVGTQIIWTLSANPDGGTTVHFAHEGWADDGGPFPMAALHLGPAAADAQGLRRDRPSRPPVPQDLKVRPARCDKPT